MFSSTPSRSGAHLLDHFLPLDDDSEEGSYGAVHTSRSSSVAESSQTSPMTNHNDKKVEVECTPEDLPAGVRGQDFTLELKELPEEERAPPLLVSSCSSFSKLKSMTSNDVHEILEPYYERKAAEEKRFQFLVHSTAEQRHQVEHGATAERTPEHWERLVNISQVTKAWRKQRELGRLNDPATALQVLQQYDPEDVLLPASLLRHSIAYGIEDPSKPVFHQHQVNGVRFMWHLLVEGPVGQVPAVGAILAHSMGLGKTAQVVVFLHLFFLAFSRNSKAPTVMLLAPKSVLSSWEAEFQKWGEHFLPSHRLKLLCYNDSLSKAERVSLHTFWKRKGGVLLLNYELLSGLVASLKAEEYQKKLSSDESDADEHFVPSDKKDKETQRMIDMVICDEGHHLKNDKLQKVLAIQYFHPLRRLLLTGTPLQNHLGEYWAMINFIIPQYYSRSGFAKYFSKPIESSAHTAATSLEVEDARQRTFALTREISSFVQRVDRKVLMRDLPPLHEMVLVAPMSPAQEDLYIRFVEASLGGGDHFSSFFLPAVSCSGKIACHPHLLYQQMWDCHSVQSSTTIPSLPLGKTSELPSHRKRSRPEINELTAEGPSSGFASPLESPTSPLCLGNTVEEFKTNPFTRLCTPPDGYYVVKDSNRSSGGSLKPVVSDVASGTIPPAETPFPLRCVNNIQDRERLLRDGPKCTLALRLVAEAIRRGEKTLLFSHSTRLLDLMEELVIEVNRVWVSPHEDGSPVLVTPILSCRIDGRVSREGRDEALQKFTADTAINLFLISTKAGGVGLTITAATRVILMDSGFNPSDDHQAVGRAYRYGQTKPVFVYRLLTHETMEHFLFFQKIAKEWLFKTVVDSSSMRRDGLKGLHARNVLKILHNQLKDLKKRVALRKKKGPNETMPLEKKNIPSILLAEDPVLAVVQQWVVEVKAYHSFFEVDEDGGFGEKEEDFYSKYREQGFFRSDDSLEQSLRNAQLQQEARRQMREADAGRIADQSNDLMRLVGNMVSESSSDPVFQRLMAAMRVPIFSSPSSPTDLSGGRERLQDISSGEDESDRSASTNWAEAEAEAEAEAQRKQRKPSRPWPPVVIDLDEENEDESILPMRHHPTSGEGSLIKGVSNTLSEPQSTVRKSDATVQPVILLDSGEDDDDEVQVVGTTSKETYDEGSTAPSTRAPVSRSLVDPGFYHLNSTS